MLDWFQMFWHWVIEPFLALAIYFGPVFFRRWKYFAYVPLYFSIYPLSHIKSDVVNKYIGSKYYPPFLEDEDEAEKLRKKTVLVISVSFILDTILIPACVAFIWSLFLDSIQFITALVILLFVQAVRFLKSTLTLYKHTYGTPQFRRWLIVVYVFALISIFLAMVETQRWVTSSLVKGSYVQLFWNLVDSLWGLFPAAIVGAVVGVIIGMTLLDKKVRQRNLNEHQTSKEPNEAVTQHSLSTQAETRNQG